MSSGSLKKGSKLRGKAQAMQKQAGKETEAREIQELNKRIAQEAPPQGSNPLSLDRPGDSFVPDAPNGASSTGAAAAGESMQAAAAAASNKAAKAAKREQAPAGVLYGAVRKFEELAISGRTKSALTAGGFTRLTDIQRAAIPHALAGRDVLGAARTGSGKTLAYLVPVLEKLFRLQWTKMDGVGALIIVPTRELAMQIFDVLRTIGKTHKYSAGLIIGGKEVVEEQERILGMNILICTPGRILHHLEQTYGFNCENLQILVLDEADRILDMGFQQSMSDILRYLPASRQTLLFSATQTRNLKELAKLSLRNPEYIAVHESEQTAVPNKLVQHYTIISADQKINLLYSYIKTHLQAKSIVFLSSGKQVRFLYEIFRRIRPGVPLLHIHGKMKQQKRMSIYYDYCSKNHALLFCTDLAARGLDFPDVDWVVQMDAPESVQTYIHRVGRTARYRSGGKALMFLLPTELAFVDELLASKKMTTLKKVKADATKMKDVTPQFASFLAENPDLQYLAKKAFVSYVRSVSLQGNKNVFKVHEIPFDALATSMGLIGRPKVALPKQSTSTNSSGEAQVSRSHLEKNKPYALTALEKAGTSKVLTQKRQKVALDQVQRILLKKNVGVLADYRGKLRAEEEQDGEGEDEDGDTFMSYKRKDHDLDHDDEGMSSESDAEGSAAAFKTREEALLAPSGFASAARDRLESADPQDKIAWREKEHARKKALKAKRKKRKRDEERGEGEEEDGVVVTLGRDDEEDDQPSGDEMEGEDEVELSASEPEDADERDEGESDDEPEAKPTKKIAAPPTKKAKTAASTLSLEEQALLLTSRR